MSWVISTWSWVVEPALLIFIIGLLVETVASSSKKIDLFTEEMCTSTLLAQSYLRYMDEEFDLINDCAKSIKGVFLNFGKMYRDIAKGTKTVNEAVFEAKDGLPEELRNNLSRLFAVSLKASNSDAPTSLSRSSFDLELKGGPVGNGHSWSTPYDGGSATEESDDSAFASKTHCAVEAP